MAVDLAHPARGSSSEQPAGRVDGPDLRARHLEVAEQLADRVPVRTISRWCQERWNISDRHARNYIRAADELLGDVKDAEVRRVRGRSLRRTEDLYELALREGDVKAALAVLKFETDLVGAAAPTRSEVKVEADVKAKAEATVDFNQRLRESIAKKRARAEAAATGEQLPDAE